MARSNEKLWRRIVERGTNKSKFRDEAGFRPAMISRLGLAEPVNIGILERICEYLVCNVADVVDYVSNDIKYKQSLKSVLGFKLAYFFSCE